MSGSLPLVPPDDLEGEDAEETGRLREPADEARK